MVANNSIVKDYCTVHRKIVCNHKINNTSGKNISIDTIVFVLNF